MKYPFLLYVKTLLLLILLLVTGIKLYSQNLLPGNRLSIHAGPTYFTSHGLYAGLRTGFQYKWGNGLGLGTEVTFPFGLNDPKVLKNEKYFRIGAEIMKYRIKNTSRSKRYYSLQINYALRKFTGLSNTFFYEGKQIDSLVIFFDKADVNTPVYLLQLTWGRNGNWATDG